MVYDPNRPSQGQQVADPDPYPKPWFTYPIRVDSVKADALESGHDTVVNVWDMGAYRRIVEEKEAGRPVRVLTGDRYDSVVSEVADIDDGTYFGDVTFRFVRGETI